MLIKVFFPAEAVINIESDKLDLLMSIIDINNLELKDIKFGNIDAYYILLEQNNYDNY